jgi:hypothetical protein
MAVNDRVPLRAEKFLASFQVSELQGNFWLLGG